MIMFDAWYNKITKNSKCLFDLGMTDTDSFLFKVSNKEKFQKHVNTFMDYSNYPSNHLLFNEKNKAKLGFFKDELCGKFKCLEFVGLRSKCYAMKLKEKKTNFSSEKKVCKGIGRSAIKNRLNFQQYRQCLFKNEIIRQKFHSIRSINHNIKTFSIQKKALNFLDTKRWIFNCGIHSVPYGSYLIQKHYGKCPRCKYAYSC